LGKWVIETCNRCGAKEEVYRSSGEPSGYYLCSKCKHELESKPKELFRHVGRSLEVTHRKESEERGVSYPSDDDYGKP